MSTAIDDIMERASQALAQMHYLACEALCLEALADAREHQQWAYYARILLPLQECRRQRRLIASEGSVQLGSTGLPQEPQAILDRIGTGCILLTHPHTRQTARELHALALKQERYFEVLFADSDANDVTWRLCFWDGPEVVATIDAPIPAWRNQLFAPGETALVPTPGTPPTPGGWFLRASEVLGDAALAQLDQDRSASIEKADALAAALQVVTDHELTHQALGRVVRQLALGAAS